MLKKSQIFLFLLFVSSSIFAKMEEITVTVQGEGLSKDLAIDNALLRAVSQANGTNLEVQNEGKLFYRQNDPKDSIPSNIDMSTKINIEDSNNVSVPETLKMINLPKDDSGIRKNFDYKTSGQIKNWKLISESQSWAKDSWIVELEVTVRRIAEYELSKEVDRKRIVVSNFRSSNKDFSNRVRDAITSNLVQSKKFAIFDRNFSFEQDSELSQYSSKSFREGEIARIGNKLGVDFIVVGEFFSLSEKQKNKFQLKTINTKFKNKRSELNIDIGYKLIDVATSQIVFSGVLQDTSIKDKSIKEIDVVREIGKTVAQKIVESIYPIKVVDVSGDQLVIAQGGDTLSIGDKYDLVEQGKKITDPYTGEFLGYAESIIGEVEIINTQASISLARVTSRRKIIELGTNLIIRSKKEMDKKEPLLKSSPIPNLPSLPRQDISKDKDWWLPKITNP